MSEHWIDAIGVDELSDDDATAVEVAGREIALYRIDGRVYATSNICTHGQARLCDGFLEGFEIECPLHQGKFDVRTGQALCAPVAEDVRTYAVKIEQNRVLIDATPDATPE